MTNPKPITVDIELDALADQRPLIAAAETEDEIGCVLRLHLVVEQILVFYLKMKRCGPMSEYVRDPRDFSGKLSLSVALGFPLEFAAILKQINKMRNELAHEGDKSIRVSDMQQLANVVSKLSAIDPEFAPLEQRFLEVPAARPGERITFGTGNLRVDFFLAVIAFWQVAIPRLVRQVATERIASQNSGIRP